MCQHCRPPFPPLLPPSFTLLPSLSPLSSVVPDSAWAVYIMPEEVGSRCNMLGVHILLLRGGILNQSVGQLQIVSPSDSGKPIVAWDRDKMRRTGKTGNLVFIEIGRRPLRRSASIPQTKRRVAGSIVSQSVLKLQQFWSTPDDSRGSQGTRATGTERECAVFCDNTPGVA